MRIGLGDITGQHSCCFFKKGIHVIILIFFQQHTQVSEIGYIAQHGYPERWH